MIMFLHRKKNNNLSPCIILVVHSSKCSIYFQEKKGAVLLLSCDRAAGIGHNKAAVNRQVADNDVTA